MVCYLGVNADGLVPDWQTQVKLPSVSVQLACTSHERAKRHSLMLTQLAPDCDSYPRWHVQP